jgi:putative restriction endonuclease
MKLWVAITDENWFEFLRARNPEEMKLRQPSAGRRAAALEPGTPFLFRLHAPDNFVVGDGFFVRYGSLPVRFASDSFGVNNGVADYTALKARVVQCCRCRVSSVPIGVS